MICNVGITDSYSIYAVENITAHLCKPEQIDENSCRGYDKSRSFFIDLRIKGQSILRPPMHITFCCKSDDINDKIVKIEYIRFLDEIKGSDKKYYSKIHENEKSIYKEKGFSKITLNAISDGIIVWPKLGYSFTNPSEEDIVFRAIEKYIHEIKGITDFEVDDYATIEEINTNYLRDEEKEDFTDWFKEKSYSIQPSMELHLQ